ncbi:putative secreted protein [Sorangium cellulosum So ce56]|uniref:Secreted protein n=1 Tax=Sorangium cellulosum (strain So ce56) TaxID=448385 RepID=A9GPV0_SORC5|nr:hypothetical protein [Sorangium cellulosum]CAN96809.1 putative secreted protein [Sorangium cellulosum So ce56]
MSFSARSFAFFAMYTLASVAACGGESSSGAGGAGGSGDDAAGPGPGSTSSGPGATSGGATSGSGGATSGSGSATTGSGTGGAASSSAASSGSGDVTTTTTSTGTGDTTTSTAATGGTDPGGCSIFCSDFEGGSLPSEIQFFPDYLRPRMGEFVTLDSTGHSGSRSVKVTGTDFSQMLGVAVPSNFWGRIYLKSATDIQMGHNTYVAAVEGNGDPNNGEQIRIGEHQCQLELNRKSDDKEMLSNGGMYMCSGGVKLVANTWYCLEFHYDGPGRSVSVFVDGTEVNAMHVTDWGPYDYKLFKFGFEKYHGGAKTMWYDDLALHSERVGCGK